MKMLPLNKNLAGCLVVLVLRDPPAVCVPGESKFKAPLKLGLRIGRSSTTELNFAGHIARSVELRSFGGDLDRAMAEPT